MSVPVWGIGPQVNKFEQVSSDDHQMSLAGNAYVQGVDMCRGEWVCPGGGYVQREWVCPGGGYVQRGVGMSRGWVCPRGSE